MEAVLVADNRDDEAHHGMVKDSMKMEGFDKVTDDKE
jgi:hypothetical protein